MVVQTNIGYSVNDDVLDFTSCYQAQTLTYNFAIRSIMMNTEIYVTHTEGRHRYRHTVLSDKHSRWVELEIMQSAASSSIIARLRQMFPRLSLPVTFTTDNARYLTSPEFHEFCEMCQTTEYIEFSQWYSILR